MSLVQIATKTIVLKTERTNEGCSHLVEKSEGEILPFHIFNKRVERMQRLNETTLKEAPSGIKGARLIYRARVITIGNKILSSRQSFKYEFY